MPSRVPVLDAGELVAMHTKTLMARRNALLKCEESFEMTDRDEVDAEFQPSEIEFIDFKNTAAWKQAYEDLKRVLSTREHVPNSIERKTIRQAKARKFRR